jgi:hypothetical protein
MRLNSRGRGRPVRSDTFSYIRAFRESLWETWSALSSDIEGVLTRLIGASPLRVDCGRLGGHGKRTVERS